MKTAEGKPYAPAWSQVLELEYQIRHRAYKRASQRNISLKLALEDARVDEKIMQDCFHGPVSLEAGAAAAREILASASAASSQSQTLARVECTNVEPPPKKTNIDKRKIEFVPGKGKQKGKDKGKAKAKAKAKATAKAANAEVSNKAAKRKMSTLCIKAGKCIRFNTGACKAENCPYPHECAVCGDPACAAYWHDL